uniref:Uncharacterized protein n=1 Tax=Physcomitrium patens TaxID=3218 RepID=A0A2K1IZ68_PHYPA|nr:hypothetical protein PHYPA_024386 [Physcomitrium patens]
MSYKPMDHLHQIEVSHHDLKEISSEEQERGFRSTQFWSIAFIKD